MYASDTLTEAGQSWRQAADTLLTEAERIGPLEEGVFGELATDEEGEAAAQRIDEQVAAMLREADRGLQDLQQNAEPSSDVHYQATNFLVGTMVVADALAVAGRAPADVFGELSVEDAQTATFADARATLAEVEAVISVPKSLQESVNKITAAGATESWSVVSGSVGTLAGGSLVSGLEGVLRGGAAVAFEAIKDHLSRWRDALKRGVVRISEWVVEKVKSLLPTPLADKVDKLIETVKEELDEGIGELGTGLYGRILGSDETIAAWDEAAKAGRDLSNAEDKLPSVTASHMGRVAWVTKGRKLIEKWDEVVAGVLAQVGPHAQLAFAALVVAVLGFVAFQVWDGFNDIAALV